MSTTSVRAAASFSVTKRKGIRPPRLEDEQIAGRIGLDRLDRSELDTVHVDDLRTDELVDPELPGDLDGLGLELHPAQTLGL